MSVHLDKHDEENWPASIKKDVEAFRIIYNKYWSKLFVYAFNVLGDKPVCEDIIQEVFISLWQKNDVLQIDNLNAYLFQSVKYQIFKHLRNGKITVRHLEQITFLQSHNDTEENLAAKELGTEISTLLDQLPERCRQIFQLSRFENLSIQEISTRLDLSEQTVKNQVSKALTYLRREISFDVLKKSGH